MDFIINSLKSKTVWGIVAAFVPQLLEMLKTQVWATDPATNEIISNLITTVALAFAYYGRIVAKGPL